MCSIDKEYEGDGGSPQSQLACQGDALNTQAEAIHQLMKPLRLEQEALERELKTWESKHGACCCDDYLGR